MAALTGTSVGTIVRESLGSLTLLIVPLTAGSTSDTWSIASTSAVVSFWAQPNIASVNTSPIDVSYVSTTGIFTFDTITYYGAFTLFVLVRT